MKEKQQPIPTPSGPHNYTRCLSRSFNIQTTIRLGDIISPRSTYLPFLDPIVKFISIGNFPFVRWNPIDCLHSRGRFLVGPIHNHLFIFRLRRPRLELRSTWIECRVFGRRGIRLTMHDYNHKYNELLSGQASYKHGAFHQITAQITRSINVNSF